MVLNTLSVPVATSSRSGNFSIHGDGQSLFTEIAACLQYSFDIARSVAHSHGLSATPVAVIQFTMSMYVNGVNPIPELIAGPISVRTSARYGYFTSGNFKLSPAISALETVVFSGTAQTQARNLA